MNGNGEDPSAASPPDAPCYYSLLGVPSRGEEVTQEEIRRAYYSKARELHPDRNSGREEEVVAEFQAVQAAYAVLSDTRSRRAYDRLGEGGVKTMREVDHVLDEMLPSVFKATAPWVSAVALVSSWSVILLLDFYLDWPVEWVVLTVSSYYLPKPAVYFTAVVAFGAESVPAWSSWAVHAVAASLVWLVVPSGLLFVAARLSMPLAFALMFNLRQQNWDAVVITSAICWAMNFLTGIAPTGFGLLAAYGLVVCVQTLLLSALVVLLLPPEKNLRSWVAYPAMQSLVYVLAAALVALAYLPTLIWAPVMLLDYITGWPFEFLMFWILGSLVMLGVAVGLFQRKNVGLLALLAGFSIIVPFSAYFLWEGTDLWMNILNCVFIHFLLLLSSVKTIIYGDEPEKSSQKSSVVEEDMSEPSSEARPASPPPRSSMSSPSPPPPASLDDIDIDSNLSEVEAEEEGEEISSSPKENGSQLASESSESRSPAFLVASLAVEIAFIFMDYYRGGPPMAPFLATITFVFVIWGFFDLIFEFFREKSVKK